MSWRPRTAKKRIGKGSGDEKPGIQAEMQGVEKRRGKNGYLHGREEEAGRRARQGAVRLQERDQGAGKCGLRMDLTGL